MKLNDYKEEVYKCSGCGMCQSVCPVYKVLKTECAVSRGKFKLLNAIINKNLNFTNKTLEIMDLCLHCQACTEFCPSGIDAQKIIETAQNDMLSCGIFSFKKFCLIQILTNKFYMKFLKIIINLIKKSHILDVLEAFNFKRICLLNEFLKIKVPALVVHSSKKKTCKALYFKGCINNYINPSCENAVKTILDKTEIEIVEADFHCCGLPLKSSGDFKGFTDIARKNLDLINDDIDYILFDCSSCLNTFFEYENFLDGVYKEKYLKLKEKFISIYELLDRINYEPKKKRKNNIVTLHYPCHTRKSEEKEFITKLIQNIPNTTYEEMNEPDSCCGAAGSFIVTNSEISKEISKNKADNIINTKANIVLTTCPSCILGLKQGLLERKSDIKLMQLIEFLAQK